MRGFAAAFSVVLLFPVQEASVVYVNSSAQVFHRNQTCQLLRPGFTGMSQEVALKRGFVECTLCTAPGGKSGVDAVAIKAKLNAVVSALGYLQAQVNDLKLMLDAAGRASTQAPQAEAMPLSAPSSSALPNRIAPASVGATAAPATTSPSTARVRCQAITRKGTQCSRMANPGSSYCWQHQR